MIPLVLLAGFLGAGKTRFLTTVIPELHARGLRVRVVLNDFENANIDAARLTELTVLVTPLAGECVCCTSLEELLTALEAAPAEPDTVMLIEANGATEADELLARLAMDRRLAQYTPPLQITVVDTKRWQKRWWHNTLEAAQVKTATHVQFNWTHKVPEARQGQVKESVQAINPRATITTAAGFAEGLRVLSVAVRDEPCRPALLPMAASADSAPEGTAHHHSAPHGSRPHAHPFASAVMPLPARVQREGFVSFVRNLPESVVRAKGFVRFADSPAEMFVWNRVEGRKAVTLDRSGPHANAQPVSLFIGVELPVAELSARIRELL